MTSGPIDAGQWTRMPLVERHPVRGVLSMSGHRLKLSTSWDLAGDVVGGCSQLIDEFPYQMNDSQEDSNYFETWADSRWQARNLASQKSLSILSSLWNRNSSAGIRLTIKQRPLSHAPIASLAGCVGLWTLKHLLLSTTRHREACISTFVPRFAASPNHSPRAGRIAVRQHE